MRKIVAAVVVIALLGFGTSRGLDWWNFNVNTAMSSSSHKVSFHIDPDESSSSIGTDLFDLRLIRSTIAWDLYVRVTDSAPKFQAGDFVLNTNMSMSQIAAALQHGNAAQQVVTFPEGFPLREQAKVVEQKKLGVSPNFFTAAGYLAAAGDPRLAGQYSFLPKQPPSKDYPYEGYLFPDTYLIDPAAGLAGLVKQQLDQFAVVFSSDLQSQIAQPTASRPAETVQSIVILASMVDREANTDSDRGNVCSVYYNRLKVNMPLGVDATLLYALGRLTPEPTAAELALNSPYNTRVHAGLPPGPISNPGQAAVMACVNPPKTNYLYYFTDPKGTTHFETNDQQFEADKQKYGVG